VGEEVVTEIYRLTQEQSRGLHSLRSNFGDDLFSHAIIFFTKSEQTMEEMLEDVATD